MMTFDRVVPEVVRICETHPVRGALTKLCLVRDVRGRVRLVVAPDDTKPQLTDLQDALKAALNAYFIEPVLSTTAKDESTRRLAQSLVDLAKQWPSTWPTEFTNLLNVATPLLPGWSGIERTIAKEAWLDRIPSVPWKLMAGAPPIVTFHSFKGGVGRTTMVAAHAVRLAHEGKRVALVDLDLEAPGLATLFGVATSRGVLDVLVDHGATGSINLSDTSAIPALSEEVGDRLTVFPAGAFDDRYVSKLARLDYSSAEPGETNPVEEALRALLKSLKAQRPKFDVILLDSRAGLHDLAGLSLHGLAHVDVLVFRGTEQNFQGLAQTLRTLRRQEPELVLIETMLPPAREEFDARRTRTRERVYATMLEQFYPEDDPPQAGDTGGAHDVVHVGRKEWLDQLDRVQGHETDMLNDAQLHAASQRIAEACTLAVEEREEGEA